MLDLGHLLGEPPGGGLVALFVDPVAIGAGCGRLLLERSLRAAGRWIQLLGTRCRSRREVVLPPLRRISRWQLPSGSSNLIRPQFCSAVPGVPRSAAATREAAAGSLQPLSPRRWPCHTAGSTITGDAGPRQDPARPQLRPALDCLAMHRARETPARHWRHHGCLSKTLAPSRQTVRW